MQVDRLVPVPADTNSEGAPNTACTGAKICTEAKASLPARLPATRLFRVANMKTDIFVRIMTGMNSRSFRFVSVSVRLNRSFILVRSNLIVSILRISSNLIIIILAQSISE